MKNTFIICCLTLPTLVGCGVTSLQKEVDWYKQQLTISEDDRNRLELVLADCENDGQDWADRNSTLRSDLDQARTDLAQAIQDAKSRRREPIEIRPVTTSDSGDPSDFAGIEGVSATRGERNEIRITLEDQILFPAGSVVIRKGGQAAVQQIAETLARGYAGREIRVVGHTDDTPPTRVKDVYPTNWELSSARACVVLRALVEANAVDPARVSAVGHGDRHPIADNTTKLGQARNRRVEVIVVGE